jgi:hypothetical protein
MRVIRGGKLPAPKYEPVRIPGIDDAYIKKVKRLVFINPHEITEEDAMFNLGVSCKATAAYIDLHLKELTELRNALIEASKLVKEEYYRRFTD